MRFFLFLFSTKNIIKRISPITTTALPTIIPANAPVLKESLSDEGSVVGGGVGVGVGGEGVGVGVGGEGVGGTTSLTVSVVMVNVVKWADFIVGTLVVASY